MNLKKGDLKEDNKDLLLKAQSKDLVGNKNIEGLDEKMDRLKDFPLKAYGNRIIVAMIETELWIKTNGGIEMKRQDGSIESKGLVLAVGEKVEGIKKFDIVHHGYHSGAVFGFGDEGFKALNDYEVLAIEPNPYTTFEVNPEYAHLLDKK